MCLTQLRSDSWSARRPQRRLRSTPGLPVISGSPAVGQTLSASPGTWSPSGTATSIRWQRSLDGSRWSDIGGATSTSYTTQAADLGTYLRVIVTASNLYGQASATSARVGPLAAGAPQNTSLPTVSGSVRIGATVTASPGHWVPTSSTYAYAWQYSVDGLGGWNSISGAGSASFTLSSGYPGTYVRVRVTATDGAGTTTAVSAAAGPVVSGAPVATALPTIAGSARVGQTLVASAGRWSPSGTLTYAWQRSTNGGASFSTITGATHSSYAIASGDAGALLRVRVTATNASGSASAYSLSVGPVSAGVQRAQLHVGQARVSARTVTFPVAVVSGAGRPRAAAVTHGRSVPLRAQGKGSNFTFSGRLSRGRWLVTVTLVADRTSFVVVIRR